MLPAKYNPQATKFILFSLSAVRYRTLMCTEADSIDISELQYIMVINYKSIIYTKWHTNWQSINETMKS